MRKTYLLILLLTAAFALPSNAVTREWLTNYAASLKGKKKAELKTAIYNMSQAKKILSYGSGTGATWDGFYSTDRVGDTKECVNRYSNKKFYFGNQGAVISGMNIEHSFPKSWWGGTKNNAYKDLFNLYPSESDANSKKSNYPMGEVTKASILDDYEKVGYGPGPNGKSIQLCEPNDVWKGDFCRSYFYMATTYQNLTWEGTQGLQQLQKGDWPTLQQWAYTLYLKWVRKDKVTQIEVNRNNAIYSIQGNRNLYIDFPTLAEYVWGDSVDVAFNPETALTTCSDDNRYASYEYTPSDDNPGTDNPGDDTPDQPGTDEPDQPTTPDNPSDPTPENPGSDNPIVPIGEYLLYDDFSSITEGNSKQNTGSGEKWSGDSIFSTAKTCYQAGGAVRIGTSKADGSIVSKPLSFTGGTLVVTIDVKGWTTVEGTLDVTVSGVATQKVSYTAVMKNNFETKTLTFTGVGANPTITIAPSTLRAFIDKVTVKAGVNENPDTPSGGETEEPDDPTIDNPDTPDPETPDNPEALDKPDPDDPVLPLPDDPDQPDTPDTPTPDDPDTPDTPTPDNPDQPENPTPENPDQPEDPQPEDPDVPSSISDVKKDAISDEVIRYNLSGQRVTASYKGIVLIRGRRYLQK